MNPAETGAGAGGRTGGVAGFGVGDIAGVGSAPITMGAGIGGVNAGGSAARVREPAAQRETTTTGAGSFTARARYEDFSRNGKPF